MTIFSFSQDTSDPGVVFPNARRIEHTVVGHNLRALTLVKLEFV